MLAADAGRDDRQAGIVDARGRAATHTGQSCMAWAGGRAGPGYAVQGNILTGPSVVDAMAETYEASSGDARRAAAARAGAPATRPAATGAAASRPRSCVVAPGGGYGGNDDRLVDLRVDDHADPVPELRRLYDIHVLLTGTTPEEQKLPLEGCARRTRCATCWRAPAIPSDDGAEGLGEALRAFVGTENLEARWWHEDRLDPVVLEHLRTRAAG